MDGRRALHLGTPASTRRPERHQGSRRPQLNRDGNNAPQSLLHVRQSRGRRAQPYAPSRRTVVGTSIRRDPPSTRHVDRYGQRGSLLGPRQGARRTCPKPGHAVVVSRTAASPRHTTAAPRPRCTASSCRGGRRPNRSDDGPAGGPRRSLVLGGAHATWSTTWAGWARQHRDCHHVSRRLRTGARVCNVAGRIAARAAAKILLLWQWRGSLRVNGGGVCLAGPPQRSVGASLAPQAAPQPVNFCAVPAGRPPRQRARGGWPRGVATTTLATPTHPLPPPRAPRWPAGPRRFPLSPPPRCCHPPDPLLPSSLLPPPVVRQAGPVRPCRVSRPSTCACNRNPADGKLPRPAYRRLPYPRPPRPSPPCNRLAGLTAVPPVPHLFSLFHRQQALLCIPFPVVSFVVAFV